MQAKKWLKIKENQQFILFSMYMVLWFNYLIGLIVVIKEHEQLVLSVTEEAGRRFRELLNRITDFSRLRSLSP